MEETIIAREITEILGIHKSWIKRRAVNEQWPYRVLSRGTREYPISSLPDDVKVAVIAHQARGQGPVSSDQWPARFNLLPAPTPAPTVRTLFLSPSREKVALAKSDLIRIYTNTLGGWGIMEHNRRQFLTAYNSGLAYPTLFEILGHTSWQTIERWRRELKKSRDAFTLADRRGIWRRGDTTLTPAQTRILLTCALHPNKPLIAEAIRMAMAVMHTRGVENGRSESTYRRWLEEWRDHNYHIWVFNREGEKAWNDKCAVYIERDITMINVGDVIVADGHTLNFEILNPWTGKPKRMTLILWYDMRSNYPLGWEIMPTENTQAISSALRRAILRLGKMPQVAYMDNGKAFSSRFFNGQDLSGIGLDGAFARLGIRTLFAWPYHGQSKPIERFFGSFAEIERWIPSFTGTSIEDKPPRLLRGERIHRSVYQKMTGGAVLTLEQAHRAVASWFDIYVDRPQKGHLDGERPCDIFEAGKGPGVDPVEIRFLMMGMVIKTIRRSQVTLLGRTYYGPELYGRTHPVMIRYDLQDPSSVWIFDESGDEFICQAPEKDKCHPAASVLGDEEDKEQLKGWIREKQSQKKDATTAAREFLEAEVIPETRRMLEVVGIQGSGIRDQRSGVRDQAEPRTPNPEPPIDEEALAIEVAEIRARTAKANAEMVWVEIERASEIERYERLIALEAQGILIPRQWRDWTNYFEQTPAYARESDWWGQKRAEAAVQYQAGNGK